MKIYTEDSIRNFNFWSGGRDTVNDLTWEDFDILEPLIEEAFGGEVEDVDLNDFFWFERDTIAEWLGYEDYEELMRDRI
jgi:hypothetical protein